MGGGRSKPLREGARPPPEAFRQLFNGSLEWFRAQPALSLQDTMILTAHDAVTLRPIYDEKPKRVCKPTKEASANMTQSMHINLLCAACWCGDFELVKLFMDKGVPVVCKPDPVTDASRVIYASGAVSACSALHCVIMTPRPVASRFEIAEYLLTKSSNVKDWINIRIPAFNDDTALECAMHQGNTPLAGLLISRGASLASSNGKNVLAMVASSGNKSLLEALLANVDVANTPGFRQSCEVAAFAFNDRKQLRTYLDFLSKSGLNLFDENFSWPLNAFTSTSAVEQFVSMGAKEPDFDTIQKAARTVAATKKHTAKSMLSMDVLILSFKMRIDAAVRRGVTELCANLLPLVLTFLPDQKVAVLILSFSHNYAEPVVQEKKDEKEEKKYEEKEEKVPFSLLNYDDTVESTYEKELMHKAAVLEIDADVDCPDEQDTFVEQPAENPEKNWANFVISDDPLCRPLPAYVDGDLRQALVRNMREPPPRVEVFEEQQPIEDDEEEKHNQPAVRPSADPLKEDNVPMTKPAFLHQPSYVMMGNSELASMQHTLVQELVDVMGLSDSEVAKLLSHYNGNKQIILSKWFADSDQVRSVVGLAAETQRRLTLEGKLREQDVLTCQLCDDSVPFDQTYALSCQHRYCLDCWKGWMDAAYDKGPAAAFTCCMADSCRLVVPREFWHKILDPERRDKFESWCTSLFVKNNVFVKWCPAAKCGRAVSYQQGGTRTIQCECGLIFCFSCLEEDHRPCSCALVAKWREKNQSEGENVNWILAHCKICPKCKSPIEKNQGCDHMTCRREAGGCGHEFCWLCKKDWRGHNNCAQFQSEAAQEEQKKSSEASTILEMYTHHYTRWASHLESSKFADAQRAAIAKKIQSMRAADPVLTENSITFLSSAAETVQACRRILAWSHALAYFLPKDSYKELFETHQSQLGAFTEQLNSFTESKVEDLIDRHFREKTIHLNRVTQKFLDNVLDFCDINYTHWSNVENKYAKCVVHCPNEHELAKFLAAGSTFICDECKADQPKDAVLWGCRQCNYDLCKDCHSKARKKLKLKSNPSAAQKPPTIQVSDQLLPLTRASSQELGTPPPSLPPTPLSANSPRSTEAHDNTPIAASVSPTFPS